MTYLDDLKEKKRKSLIAICTLGFSTVPISKLWTRQGDPVKETHIGTTDFGPIIGFILKLVFCLSIAVPWALVMFIYHLCRYFYLRSQEKRITN